MYALDRQQRTAVYLSGAWLLLTYLLTTLHHLYSSLLYAPESGIAGVFAGSWRAHGFLVFLVPLLLCAGALARYARTRQRGWLHAYGAVNGLLFIGLIGLWEGGWNHLAKLFFFAFGAEGSYAYGPSWLLQFPTVVPPADLFFEATGVLTLVFGILNARYLWRLRRIDGPPLSSAADPG